jgi:hypothetical protein
MTCKGDATVPGSDGEQDFLLKILFTERYNVPTVWLTRQAYDPVRREFHEWANIFHCSGGSGRITPFRGLKLAFSSPCIDPLQAAFTQ